MKKTNLFFISVLLFTSLHAPAQQSGKISYEKLKSYEGLYEYFNNSTLQLAVSPKDTLLYAIINKSQYALKPHDTDVFLNAVNVPVQFLRNSAGQVSGYITNKDTFKLISRKVNRQLFRQFI